MTSTSQHSCTSRARTSGCLARSIDSRTTPGAWNGLRPDGVSRSRARSDDAVDDVGLETAAHGELRSPLVAHGERREDENAIGRPARGQLAEDQAGLDRLSLPDGIGQQQSRGPALESPQAPATAGAAATRRAGRRGPPTGSAGQAADGQAATQRLQKRRRHFARAPRDSRARADGRMAPAACPGRARRARPRPGAPAGRRRSLHAAHRASRSTLAPPPVPPPSDDGGISQRLSLRHVATPAYAAR